MVIELFSILGIYIISKKYVVPNEPKEIPDNNLVKYPMF